MPDGLLRRLLPLAPIAAVVLLPLPGLWQAAGPPMEEGFMLVFPELVLEGMVPNRDFLHLYGPGSLWVLAGLYWLFGTSLATQRAVGYLQHLGVAFGAFALLRPWGPIVASTGGVVAALIVLTPSGLSALAWVGGVALALWALRSALEGLEGAGRRRDRHLWLAGLLGGAALLYRLDLVLAVAGSLFVVWWWLDSSGRRKLVLASLVGVSPYLVHLATAGPGNVLRGMVVEPVFELRGGRRLPLPPSWDDYDGFLQRAGTLDEPPWPLPAPRGPVQLNLWLLAILAGTVLLLVAGVRCARQGRPRLLAMAVLAAGLLPQALQRADSTHLAWVSAVTFAFLPAAVVELVPLRWRGAGWRVALPAAALPALILVAAIPYFPLRYYGESVGQTFGYRRNAATMGYDGRTFRYARADAVAAVNELLPLVDELTEPGDRLFVGPGDLSKTPYSEAFLYYLLPDLVPATRYIEMDPGVANAEDSGLADELRSSDVVILSSIRDDWNEPNDSLVTGSQEPNEVLAEEFCLVASFEEGLFGRGLYEVYMPTRADPPCA